MNVCIIGDSITWGAYLPFRGAWANLLRNHLEKKTDYFVALYDLGIDGDTSSDILKRFDVEMEARNPSVIIVAVGTNDSVYRLKNKERVLEIPTSDFKQNVKEIISKAKKYTKDVLWVGLAKGDDNQTTPLIRSTTGKCYDKQNIKKYNSIIRNICEAQQAEFIDIYEKLSDKDFDDGLHPNIVGHTKIFEQVRNSLEKYIEIKADEYYIIVDENDNEVGYKKRQSLDTKDIARVSALWIENDDEEVLIAKRPYTKKRDAGKWGPAVANLLKKDETYKQAIIKAADEEIGLKDIEPVEAEKMLIEGYNTFFCKWYKLISNKEIKDFKINEKEVEQLKWIGKKKLMEQNKNNKFMFVQSFDRYCEKFI